MVGLRRWCAAAVVLLAACNSSEGVRLTHLSATHDYLPGVAADVFLPTGQVRSGAAAPLVVLVPGGGWRSADRRGLQPLADALAAHGVAAVTATYRIGSPGVRFPVPVADIVCAVDFAVSQLRHAGDAPRPVVLLGHSSGAQLAAVAALAADHFRAQCPYPAAAIDGFVGLAGAYDLSWYRDEAISLFGARQGDAPASWHAADPFTWVGGHPALRILLLHGADDSLVSPMESDRFATKLRAAGHRVSVHVMPHADHAAIYSAGVATEPIVRWLSTWRR